MNALGILDLLWNTKKDKEDSKIEPENGNENEEKMTNSEDKSESIDEDASDSNVKTEENMPQNDESNDTEEKTIVDEKSKKKKEEWRDVLIFYLILAASIFIGMSCAAFYNRHNLITAKWKAAIAEIEAELMPVRSEGEIFVIEQAMNDLKYKECRLKELSDEILNDHYPRRMEKFDRTNKEETAKVLRAFSNLLDGLREFHFNSVPICALKEFEDTCSKIVDAEVNLYQQQILYSFIETRNRVWRMQIYLNATPALFYNAKISLAFLDWKIKITKGTDDDQIYVNDNSVYLDGKERNGIAWKLLSHRQISMTNMRSGTTIIIEANACPAEKKYSVRFETNRK